MMEHPTTMSSENSSLKRPRSPTETNTLPVAKVPRTANHLQINYLARQHKETIPLVTVNDKLPEIARLIGEYDGVLQRHESMAGNLGACPLGPILLKRFERLFEGPPRILKAHGKDANVSWLDVVEFAQSNPKQFNLERTRNGVRVCQFYTKQCRVEISEEDYVLIASGMPQKLIPPQPILEDEEKELGVMELLDRNLGQVIQLADQVSARARQLIHKMKNRRTAIVSRREHAVESKKVVTSRLDESPLSPVEPNGVNNKAIRSIEVSQSPPVGFTAVNMRTTNVADSESRLHALAGEITGRTADDLFNPPGLNSLNGRSLKDVSSSSRTDLNKFLTASERDAGLDADTIRRSSFGQARASISSSSAEKPQRSRSIGLNDPSSAKQSASVAIPNTPASLMPQSKPSTMERDDGGPFKSEMVRRMDNMWKGDRVIPPCDRCRRLHMDCLKNLTACMGCTKKHAKCSWKEVRAEELELAGQGTSPDREPAPAVANSSSNKENNENHSTGGTIEVNRPMEEAQASATGERTHTIPAEREVSPKEPAPETTRAAEPATNHTGRFDVRPPPYLQQQLQETASEHPSIAAHSTSNYATYSPSERHDDDDDAGDRLQALAARVYRSASQSGHRPHEA